jgi:hypothetical protein
MQVLRYLFGGLAGSRRHGRGHYGTHLVLARRADTG